MDQPRPRKRWVSIQLASCKRIVNVGVAQSVIHVVYMYVVVFRTLISKATSDGLERNYVLTVSESTISLDYLPDTLASGTQRYRNANVSSLTFDPTQWHHITVTVYAQDAVFYVNGSVVSVQALAGRIVDDVTRDVLLGQLAPGL